MIAWPNTKCLLSDNFFGFNRCTSCDSYMIHVNFNFVDTDISMELIYSNKGPNTDIKSPEQIRL